MNIINQNNIIYDPKMYISTYKKDYTIPKIKYNNNKMKHQQLICRKLSIPKYNYDNIKNITKNKN